MSKEYKKLRIQLTDEERAGFERMVRCGVSKAMDLRRANVLLLADESGGRKRKKDVHIAELLGISVQTIHNIKENFILRREPPSSEDVLAAIRRKSRETPPVPAKITGEKEAQIIALACSAPPEGRTRWTLRLLSERIVELEIVESISYVQVGRVLKKRIQATSEEDVVHSSQSECDFCCRDGGCPGSVFQTLRPEHSGRVHG